MASLAHFPSHVIEDAKRKAAELEDFQGMGVTRLATASAEDDDDGSRAKRRKSDRDAADKMIDDVLKEWDEFKRGDVSSEESSMKLDEIRRKVAATENEFLMPFVKGRIAA